MPIIHKYKHVYRLSWQQLRDIFTGRIKNWNEVGGPDLRIRVVTSHAGSATRAMVQKLVMKGDTYAANAKTVNSTRRELVEVSKLKGSIGAVSLSFFEQNPGSTKVVESEQISRPLALITVGEPSPDVQALIDFFKSPEGQVHVQ